MYLFFIVADALCNAARDARHDWRRIWPASSWLDPDRHGILAFSDGSYRGPGLAAIGRIIYFIGVSDCALQVEPMAAETKFVYEGINDAFLAKVLALDACINHIHIYVCAVECVLRDVSIVRIASCY